MQQQTTDFDPATDYDPAESICPLIHTTCTMGACSFWYYDIKGDPHGCVLQCIAEYAEGVDIEAGTVRRQFARW